MASAIERPMSNEYDPYYAGYIQRVPEGDILTLLAQQIETTVKTLSGLTEQQGNFRFAPKEWSIKQVIGHLSDTERIFAYRALCISRRDPTPLPGFDQEVYVSNANFEKCSLADILQEFEYTRRANVLAFKQLTPEMSCLCGKANNAEISVRALVYNIAGHELHHLESLQKEYLPLLK